VKNTDPTQAPRPHRFHAGLPASVEVGGRRVECRADNLSRAGMLLAGDFPPPGADELQVTIRSSSGDLRLTATCRLVRCRIDAPGGETLIGVEFGPLGPDEQQTLDSLVARVIECVAPNALNDLPERATPQQIRSALEGVSLPHRIQLAMRGLPREREMLLHDPHLQVIDALARNPNLLLHEVMTILRMVNVLPHTLDVIARDSRWSANRQVRVLAATHRNTPFATANRIIEQMAPDALQRLLQASGLQPALREKALRRLPGGLRR